MIQRLYLVRLRIKLIFICIKKRKFLHNYNRIFADIHLRKYLFIFFFLIYL